MISVKVRESLVQIPRKTVIVWKFCHKDEAIFQGDLQRSSILILHHPLSHQIPQDTTTPSPPCTTPTYTYTYTSTRHYFTHSRLRLPFSHLIQSPDPFNIFSTIHIYKCNIEVVITTSQHTLPRLASPRLSSPHLHLHPHKQLTTISFF